MVGRAWGWDGELEAVVICYPVLKYGKSQIARISVPVSTKYVWTVADARTPPTRACWDTETWASCRGGEGLALLGP